MIVGLSFFGSRVSLCPSFVHVTPDVGTYLFAETTRRTICAFLKPTQMIEDYL